VPGGDDTAGDGFTNRGNFHFNGHARGLRKVIERRGRSAFRQPIRPSCPIRRMRLMGRMGQAQSCRLLIESAA
jgi:hypothetical protein